MEAPHPVSDPQHKPRALAAVEELVTRYPVLRPAAGDVERAFGVMVEAFDAGAKLLVCGNGGSAADAEHFTAELLKSFECDRPIKGGRGLPAGLGEKLQAGLAAVPLTGFTSLRTAVANDCDASLEFAQLVEALGRGGDVLMAISTSGRSASVIHAATVARARGMKVVALTGQDGGPLAGMADVAVRVAAARTRDVQELHLPVYHTLALMLEVVYFGYDPPA